METDMKFSRIISDKASPTPRERTADPQVRLRKILSKSKPLPAPGSAEARTAFEAACREHGRQIQLIGEYPELKRAPLTWWTTNTLGTAINSGDVTPAKCAQLYPLAAERELHMAMIAHRLQLGALHALAFADSFPVSSESNGERLI